MLMEAPKAILLKCHPNIQTKKFLDTEVGRGVALFFALYSGDKKKLDYKYN